MENNLTYKRLKKAPVHTKRAFYTIKEIKSPIHETSRGCRLIVALPNAKNGIDTKTGEPKPSFAREYQLAIFGDLPDMDIHLVNKFLAEVTAFTGITDFTFFLPD